MSLDCYEKNRQLLLELDLVPKANSNTFEWFTVHIQHNEVTTITQDFLSHFTLSLNVRDFISTFILAYFPDCSLSSERNELEECIHQKSKEVIKILYGDDFNRKSFSKVCEEYYQLFNVWKKRDKEDLVKILTKTHKQVRSLSGEVADQYHIDKTLSKIENIASQLGGDKVVKHVKTSSEVGLIDQNMIIGQTVTQIHQSFWDIFTSELAETPSNFGQYPSLISEIRVRLEKILANLKRPETISYIREHVDENLIDEKISRSEYSLQDIYNLCIFCLERVKEMGDPDEEITIQFYIDRVHSEMVADEVKIHEIVPNTFKFVLERLDHIIILRKHKPV